MINDLYSELSNCSTRRFSIQLASSRLRSGAVLLTMLMSLLTVKSFAVCNAPQFGSPVVLPVDHPTAVAPGDYNRDGRVDLAIGKNVANGQVEILLGDGSGGFNTTGVQYNLFQFGASSIVSGDFNNDGLLDLLVIGFGGGSYFAAVLTGDGSGGFGAPIISPVPYRGAVAIGDFNNDNNLDFITTNFNGSSVSILPGQGNGSFGTAFSFTVGDGPIGVLARDFNNDGKLDFITVDSDSSQVSVRLGNGNFTFTSPNPAAISLPDPGSLTANDFNRDGKLDFAAANNATSNISVRLGAGNGVFNAPVGDPFAVGPFPQRLVSADFNSDLIPDIAVANFGEQNGSNNLSLLLNNGAGSFGSAFNFTIGNRAIRNIYTVDINQNGAADLILFEELNSSGAEQIVLLTNTCPPPNKPRFDFDGDGKADISLFRPSNGIWYRLNSGSGNSFFAAQFGIAEDKIAPADYDGDGKTDLAVFRPSSGVWYLLQSTIGISIKAFGQAGDIPAPADYDGDGKADIAVFRPSTNVWYVLRSASGVSTVQFGQSGDVPQAGDFDGDGKADISLYRPSNGVWYRLNSSNNQFVSTSFGTSGDVPDAADYDGDGKTDLAVFRPSSGVWYLQQSTNGFAAAQFGFSGDRPAAADYDGDGKADLALFRSSSGAWYINRSTGGFFSVQFGVSGDVSAPSAFVP